MKEAFDKIKERLVEKRNEAEAEMYRLQDEIGLMPCVYDRTDIEDCKSQAFIDAKNIVSEVEAEYGNGKTNADRIRKMSDEELAEYIEPRWFDCSDFCEDFDAGCAYTCKHNKGAEFLLNWLKSPTTD